MKKSFTLIELLVVVGITALFVGLAIPKFNDFNDSKKLEQEEQKLVDVLELAKNKVSATDLSPSIAPGIYCDIKNFIGYQVDIQTRTYTLNFCCNAACTDVNSTFIVKTYNLQNNIGITASQQIMFEPLSGGGSTSIILYSPGNKCRIIKIDSSVTRYITSDTIDGTYHSSDGTCTHP